MQQEQASDEGSPARWEFSSHNKSHGTPDFFLFWLCFVINFFHTPIPSFLKLNKGALPVLAISHGCDKRRLTRISSLSLVWRHRPPQLGRRGSSHGCRRSSWLKRLTSGWTRERKEMDAGPCLYFSFFFFLLIQLTPAHWVVCSCWGWISSPG